MKTGRCVAAVDLLLDKAARSASAARRTWRGQPSARLSAEAPKIATTVGTHQHISESQRPPSIPRSRGGPRRGPRHPLSQN